MDARNESGRDDRNRRNDEQGSNLTRADRLKKLQDELNTLESGTESQKNRILRKDLEGGDDRPREMRSRNSEGDRRPWTPREGGNDRPRYDNDRPRFERRDDQGRPERRFSKDKNGRVDTRRKKKGDEPVRPVTINFDEPMRLNRYIANAGVCSRRRADELIANGSITVNGNVITELGSRVNPGDVVTYNDKVLSLETLVYVLLNKPKDFITTLDDPEDRRTVMSLVEKATDERIFPVGRLDRNTTGLLLLTNDGEVAQKLTHPSNEIAKVYDVSLDKPLTKADFEKISAGVELEDGMAYVDAVAFPDPEDKTSVGLEIHSGRNRIVRRIFESLGYDVIRLDRVLYAGLTKKDLPRGNWRYLSEREIRALKSL